MIDEFEAIKGAVKQAIEEIKSMRGKLTFIDILGIIVALIYVLSCFALITVGMITQKNTYLITFAVLICVGVPIGLLIGYSKNWKSKKIKNNPNALEGIGCVAYSVRHTETQIGNRIIKKYKTAIYAEFSDKPLLAISEERFSEYDYVDILYLKNSKYCYIVGLHQKNKL